ncbi:MAG: hypothetical protein ACON4T_05900 [Synechococcus sp.]
MAIVLTLADQLLARNMNELDISLVLARLRDEHYNLTLTDFLADVQAPNRIQAIETFIWQHLQVQFRGRRFAINPELLRAHMDWGNAWRQLRLRYGLSCVQLPKDPNQPLVHFVFVAGPNALCPNRPELHRDQGDPHYNDHFVWEA